MPYVAKEDDRYDRQKISALISQYEDTNQTMKRMAAKLNLAGFRTRSGCKWSHASVSFFRRKEMGLEARCKKRNGKPVNNYTGFKTGFKNKLTTTNQIYEVIAFVDLYKSMDKGLRVMARRLIEVIDS